MHKNSAKALIGWKPVNERIITARFRTKHAKVTVKNTDNLNIIIAL